MKFLLDVSALLSLGVLDHEFHDRTAKFLTKNGITELATCAITELGFVRALAQAPQYRFTVAQARDLLVRLKKADVVKFTFIVDHHDVTHLPGWVKTAKQVTDGHLLELAKANGAALATLDRGIPGAVLIPA
ncbi:MAG: PIN domain-containing protein [Terriglobia bacterium]